MHNPRCDVHMYKKNQMQKNLFETTTFGGHSVLSPKCNLSFAIINLSFV
jgi:hypothetical protein